MELTKSEKIFKYYHLVFLGLLSILLIYSFDFMYGWILNLQFPDIYSFTLMPNYRGREPIFWTENGLIETLQVVIVFISLVFLIKIFPEKKNIDKNIIIFLFMIFFGLIYIFLEEISWGQHYFGFKSPQLFLKKGLLYNKQAETNLHNISNIFNEIPRNLVLIWCSLSIIFCRLFFNNSSIAKLVEPNKKLILLSLILLVISTPEIIITKFDLFQGDKLFKFNKGEDFLYFDFVFQEINLKQLIYSILIFEYVRFSELQELFFYNYFMWYIIFLREYLTKLPRVQRKNGRL